MTQPFQLSIEGAAAEDAAESLSEIKNLNVTEKSTDTDVARSVEGLAVLVSVVAVMHDAVELVEQLRKWREKYRHHSADQPKTIDKVILMRGEERIEMDHSTDEELVSYIKHMN